MEDCVGFFSSLYSTSQLPWSAWAVPPCCVCLPLLSSPMSHPCSSLPWFPWQSCATSSRSTSEWHPGKKEPRASPFRQWKWSLQCRAALCLNLVLSRLWHCLQVGQIHYSGNVILQAPWLASRASERHEQGFCAWSKVFGVHKKNPAGFCPPPRAVCWVHPRKCDNRTGKLQSACPGESGNMLSQGEAAECSITMVVLLAVQGSNVHEPPLLFWVPNNFFKYENFNETPSKMIVSLL